MPGRNTAAAVPQTEEIRAREEPRAAEVQPAQMHSQRQ